MSHLPGRRVLAFIDFLGFRSIVKRMASEPDLYELIRNNLSEINEDFARRKAAIKEKPEFQQYGGYYFPMESTQFSDSLVVSASIDVPDAVEEILWVVSSLSDRLLMKGLFVRGGISLGWAYHQDNIVFGEAMVDAYQLESTVATYPRVVLADEVYRLLPPFIRENSVRRDADGIYYSRLFKHLWFGDQIATPDPDQLQTARDQIEHGLLSSFKDLGINAKYRWLANRFDDYIRECRKGMWKNSELGATLRTFSLEEAFRLED